MVKLALTWLMFIPAYPYLVMRLAITRWRWRKDLRRAGVSRDEIDRIIYGRRGRRRLGD